MPGRGFSATGAYRYGFNGKENDNGTGEWNLDFGARIYDSRLGRWLSVDAFADKYPNYSPYSFGVNSPLQFKDANGHWLVDQFGNIIYTVGQTTYEKGDGYLYEVNQFIFYTNDGQAVIAGTYTFKTELSNVVWNDKGDWPKRMVDDDLRIDIPIMSPENSSCHGNTLKLRVGASTHDLYIPGIPFGEKQGDNVSKIYKNKAEFTPINSKDVKPGDVAIFEDENGNIQHAATVTSVGKKGRKVRFTSKDDRKPVAYNQTKKQIMRNRNYVKFGGYYRHNDNVNVSIRTTSPPGFVEDNAIEEILKNVKDKDNNIPKNSNADSTQKTNN